MKEWKNNISKSIMYLLPVKMAALLVIVFIMGTIIGCQKQEEKKPVPQSAPGTATTATADTAKKSEPKAETLDIKGTWKGTFDQRATTLKITEQTGNDFKGTITINYREVINQQVSGKFDPATKKLTMKDLLHSRYQGSYAGTLSDDMKKMNGTFTMQLDKSKFSFNLAKK